MSQPADSAAPASVTPPALVAHRGDARRFPENTMPSVLAALAAGAVTYVEIDVQLARDGTPVLLHDVDLARTTGREGRVTDFDATSLAAIAAGEPERLGDAFGDVCIPPLRDVVTLLASRPAVTLFVELKGESLETYGVTRVVEAVAAALVPLGDRAVIIATDVAALEAARHHGFAVGWILRAYDEESQARATALAPSYLFVNHERLPPAGPLWRGPWRWVVYEVDEPDHALALAARGAALVETMAIAEMHADPRLAPREGAGDG